MHLIFERSNGRIQSNCNILALAWMPYYVETKFRQALLDYHQKQLINLGRAHHHLQHNHRFTVPSGNVVTSRLDNSPQLNNHTHDNHNPGRIERASNNFEENNGNTHSNRNNDLPVHVVDSKQFLNSRLAELYQRYLLAIHHNNNDKTRQLATTSTLEDDTKIFGEIISQELGNKYGRLSDFGWLVVGNVGKSIGVTLTSTIPPPHEISGRDDGLYPRQRCCRRREDDLMVFDDAADDDNTDGAECNSGENSSKKSSTIGASILGYSQQRHLNLNEATSSGVGSGGAAATGSSATSSMQSIEFEHLRPDRRCKRSNYNLGGHIDEVILVRWNELFQKLATVDSKGNVLIWCKVNEKFTIQTPFYNRTKSVADFRWSNDGKTALICYTDSFILIGSSSGQRHWHSMLNLDEYHITCASWTPNDDQLLLGVSNGNVVVIDLPQSELTELCVSQVNIRTISWSSYEMNLNHLGEITKNQPASLTANTTNNNATRSRDHSSPANARYSQFNTTIVNQRRLSRDCSVFSRYRFCSQAPNIIQPDDSNHSASREAQKQQPVVAQKNILAIEFANNTIKLYDGGLQDSEPRLIRVNLESFIMSWSGDGKLLAVAGFNIHTSAMSVGCLKCRYLNSIKFYNQQAELVHEYAMKYTRYPITAFTWAHDDQRIFVATGPKLHCAKLCRGIPSLSLLAMSRLQRETRLAHKYDALECLIGGKFSQELLKWQSFNCPIKPATASNYQHKQNTSTSDRSPSLTTNDSNDDTLMVVGAKTQLNNVNVLRYELPLKLKLKLDNLFAQTIRKPIDDQLSLTDIVWQVPKNQQRYHCTLICYTSERMDKDTGSFSQQYRNDLHDRKTNSQPTDQYKVFVLYIEFEGSLVPILRARRIGYLKPEFVLFDPEDVPIKLFHRNPKVSDISQALINNQRQQQQQYCPSAAAAAAGNYPHSHMDSASNYLENCVELHNSYSQIANESIDSSYGRHSSLSSAEHYYNFDQSDTRIRQQSQQDKLANNLRSLGQNSLLNDPYLSCLLNLSQQQRSKATPGNSQLAQDDLKLLLDRYRSVCRANTTSYSKTLPETNELVRIRSNVWGTKFKIINKSNRMISQRAILGTVTYKASLLHLQPRQIFLTVKDMSNYCSLCSTLHHNKLPATMFRESHKVANKLATPTILSHPMDATKQSLIDMPNTFSVTPSKSKRSAATPTTSAIRQGDGSRGSKLLVSPSGSQRKRSEDNKVVLLVGDSLKIAPKLEQNQKYSQASKGYWSPFNNVEQQQPSTSTGHTNANYCQQSSLAARLLSGGKKLNRNDNRSQSSSSSSSSSSTHRRHHNHYNKRHSSLTRQGPSEKYWSIIAPMPAAGGAVSNSCNSMNGDTNDDILTLSLDQGDQVKVEMSSLSRIEQQPLAPPPQPPPRSANHLDNRQLSDFLDSNKTLKSIQTITKMIVDLSSRGAEDGDDDDGEAIGGSGSEVNLNSSPSKLIKLSSLGDDNVDANPTSLLYRQPACASISSKYIPPETPVHRPRKTAALISALNGDRSQSANTTPLKFYRTSRRRNRRDWHPRLSIDNRSSSSQISADDPVLNPLPPPPPQRMPISRRISSSAKRFIDGSLRSLYEVASAGKSGGVSGDDPEPEEHEPLVSSRPMRYRSQPCTPMKSCTIDKTIANGSKRTNGAGGGGIDLNSLRDQLLKRLRNPTTNWGPTEANKANKSLACQSDAAAAEVSTSRSRARYAGPNITSSLFMANSRTPKRVGRKSASRACSRERQPTNREPDVNHFSNLDDARGGADRPLDYNSDSSCSMSSSDDDDDDRYDYDNRRDFDFVAKDRHLNGRLKAGCRLSFSAKALDELGGAVRAGKRRDGLRKSDHNDRPMRRRSRRKSICDNLRCCCANEFKLNNRPPVWNEQSQVYQLDFGGRVTQESAKNLQIDFDGNLALQFGRIDQCTYTLDFKHPFNAVQAMSIALASLTQRMK